MWRKQNPHALILLVQSLWETIWSFLKKLNLKLPYKPTILLLGIYLREMKIYGHTKICIQMFTEALFIIVKQMRTVHTSILVNAQWFKKKEGSYDTYYKSMILKNIMLKRRQTQRPHIVWFHLHEILRKSKSIDNSQRRKRQPMKWQFTPEEFHGQRSLVGYSPRGHKELDMAEQLTQIAD